MTPINIKNWKNGKRNGPVAPEVFLLHRDIEQNSVSTFYVPSMTKNVIGLRIWCTGGRWERSLLRFQRLLLKMNLNSLHNNVR